MTIIFSDTHLTPEFNHKLFNKLKKIISRANRVIINGDFWDGYLTNFDTFINSEWRKLFKLLKKKKTVYVFGNHDPEDFGDHRYHLFSDRQCNFFRFKSGNQLFHVEHGDKLNFNLTFKTKPLIPFLRRGYRFIDKQKNLRTVMGNFFDYIAKLTDEKGDDTIFKYMAKRKNKDKHFYIFGHTHIPRFYRKLRYANPGRIDSHQFGYIEIINGICRLKKI